MRVQPFRALRPPSALANAVGSVAYDTVDAQEAKALANGNAHSFLHVIRPDVDLPAGVDAHSDEAYAQAFATLQRFRDEGTLVTEDSASLYVYRIESEAHSQTGVVGCCHVEDYESGAILRHEKTRPDKEADRTRLNLELRAHTGPVLMTYRSQDVIDGIVAEIATRELLLEAGSEDGAVHRLWRVDEPGALVHAFNDVSNFYVADGHHRAAAAAAAARVLAAENPAHSGEEEYNWFLAALFPDKQLKIMAYNRCVSDFGNRSERSFIEALRGVCDVTMTACPVPFAPKHVSCYINGSWMGIRLPEPDSVDPVAGLDVSQLQDRVLGPLLGIDDPRTNSRIEFVGGIRGTTELETKVDSGQAAVAFSLYPLSVSHMIAIADAGKIMPPKSTWFEPKARSGLLVHTC